MLSDWSFAMNSAEIALHDHLVKTRHVTVLYDGDCRGCGECCSRYIPLNAADVIRLRGFVKRHGIEQRPPRADIDLTCPYLTDGNTCAVYDARPMICRTYRCDRHAKGDFSEYAGHETRGCRMRDMREVI